MHDSYGDSGPDGPQGQPQRPRSQSRGQSRPEPRFQVTVGSVLEDLEVGVAVLDPGGRIQVWSPLAEEMLGWPAERVVGYPFASLISDEPSQRGPAQHDLFAPGPANDTKLYTRLLSEWHWRGLLQLRHFRGHVVDTSVRATLMRDGRGATSILANIVKTEAMRSIEQDLAALDALYASSTLGVGIFGTDMRYVRVNQALADLHRLPREELLGRTLVEVLPEPTASRLTQLQEQVLATGRPVVDEVMPGAYGVGHRSVSYTRLLDPGGRVLGLSATIIDVTERIEALEKTEKSRQRLKLLDDVGVVLGELLDPERISQSMLSALVPRFADYMGVGVYTSVARGGEPAAESYPEVPLMEVSSGGKGHSPLENRFMSVSQGDEFAKGTLLGKVLKSGEPILLTSPDQLRQAASRGVAKAQEALAVGVHSVLVLPLTARGVVLGVIAMSRTEEREPFDEDDLALGMELASRAGISLENARLYAVERESALVLQRSLLPQRVPSPPGVGVAYRYVPGSTGAEVGGDWFDVVALPGGRVALVVGDVMGHGLHAAATMGRLRTAVRTLAGLDLPPHEVLGRVNDLADDLVPGTDEPLMTTCLYAVFDPSTSRCTLSMAGHVPPLLLTPRKDVGRWDAVSLELPSGTPLGVGGGTFQSQDLEVEEGSVLVLYTDGLVETRGGDIGEGINRLCSQLARMERGLGLEEACDQVIARLGHQGEADDVALLMAQLGGVPEGSTVSWTFPAKAPVVSRARRAVRETLRCWGLDSLVDETQLLVSELVTNALRYTRGPIGVRMVRTTSLLVEVSDPLLDPPHERRATEDDEGGRGIQLVARQSRRWGTRYGPLGKTVWFELPLPG